MMQQSSLSLPHDALSRIKMLKEMRDRSESRPADDRNNTSNLSDADGTDRSMPSADK